jgi:hypothetical protein
MDQRTLVLLIPIFALAIGFIVVVKLPRKAFSQRSNPGLGGRVQALEGEVGSLRQELSDAQERLDFAERVLARADEARRLDTGT